MKFYNIIAIVLVAYFSNAVAAAVPVGSTDSNVTALISRAGGLISTDTITSLEARGNFRSEPYCTPTGDGVCNLAFHNLASPNGEFDPPQYVSTIMVYDRWCKELGRVDKIYGKFELFSQLRYVVVGNAYYVEFKYANSGLKTGGNCITYYADKDHIWRVWQCAFNC